MEKAVIDIEKTASILKLLGDKTRLAMVALMNPNNECCVCEFVGIFNMSQPSISQHLRKMRDVGLVKEKRKGQWIFYSLNTEHETYPMIHTLLEHVPNQREKLDELEAKGLRIKCCN
jgi:ArsR family transcriptional regulator, arsenate/arsenite/antimonite-responsive transcriptional repressor